MPRNVEIKARVENLEEVKQLAKKLSGDDGTLIEQEDTFFNSPQGYLKLREIKDAKAQLIYYERPVSSGPKLSDYHVTLIENPAELKLTLSRVCGEKGSVRKHRMLYMVGQTRVHCDRVDELGDFMELEVQLEDSQSEEEGTAIADDLMNKLNIHKDNLVTGAYMDQILKMKKLASAQGDGSEKPRDTTQGEAGENTAQVTAPAVEVGN